MLAQAGVADEDTLYILARLMGGAKKRKKKTYTKPKKQKHKHKKIKLRVLKFFKVVIVYAINAPESALMHNRHYPLGHRHPSANSKDWRADCCSLQESAKQVWE